MKWTFDNHMMIGDNVFIDLRNVFMVRMFEDRQYRATTAKFELVGYKLYVNNIHFATFSPEEHDEAVKLINDILDRMKTCR